MCRAGEDQVPFEDFYSRNPTWYGTLHQATPWVTRPIFCNLDHVPGEEASLFAWDLFHALHLGVGKAHVSSCLAALSDLQVGSTVDARFQTLNADYQLWCKSGSYLQSKLTKEFIAWPSRTEYPNGSWHKAHITTNLLLYLEQKLGNMDLTDQSLLQAAAEATTAINKSMRLLYESGELFLQPELALQVGELGLRFLRRYASLARLSYNQGKTLWTILPKCHVCHHIYVTLAKQGSSGMISLSPLGQAVQQDEDFVGRPSRISRKVGVKSASHRVLERYLKSAYDKYVAAGYLVT